MGGIDTAKELITRSLANGKQVVTANKALLAEEGESLFRLADEKGATLLYDCLLYTSRRSGRTRVR